MWAQMRVSRPSRFCLGGDFVLLGERLGIVYHAVCSRADESQHTHPREAWVGHPAAKTCFNCTAMDPSGATRPSQRKKCAGIARRVYIGAAGSQNGHSNVRISDMAASKRSRRAQAPINILLCAAVFFASFVVYWMGLSAYEQRLRPSKTEGVNDLVQSTFPSSPRSTHPYVTPESANIKQSAVQCRAVPCGTSYALDGTSPPLATPDSYATPGFKGIFEEEGKRAGEITKAKKEETQTQAAPPRVREAPPKAISPPDAELTLADASGADLSDLSVPAFQRPAVPGPAVRVPALQGPDRKSRRV